MKKVFLTCVFYHQEKRIHKESIVVEGGPIHWSSNFSWPIYIHGWEGVTLKTAHDIVPTPTAVRVCTLGTNSYRWYTKKQCTMCTLLHTNVPGFLPYHTW